MDKELNALIQKLFSLEFAFLVVSESNQFLVVLQIEEKKDLLSIHRGSINKYIGGA